MNDVWTSTAHVRTDVLLVAGLIPAVVATVHILLRKVEVQSAVGWIGLVWFAPITGSILYFLLGVNRVQRRARRGRGNGVQRAASDAGEASNLNHLRFLQRAVGRITRRPVLAGNAVQMLENGDAAYPAMLEAIGRARRSVGLSSYIFRDDVWGRRFIEALSAAQRRGVIVRVLIDGIGGGWLLSAAYHRLRRNNVPAARFFHSLLPWRMPFINLRSHKKVLVIDGVVGFSGGMNIADQNVQAIDPKKPVVDTHFRIEGPVTAQLVENFLADWNFAAGEMLDRDAWFHTVPDGTGTPARVIDSGPDKDLEKIEYALLEAVACAQESIAIMTPYFLPDDRMVTAVELAAMRGIEVDVVIPAISDHKLVDWATRANIGPMLIHGVRIWRCPPPFRHSKVVVVDGEWCLVGSSNWDIRSFRLNFELCLEFYDRDLAAKLTAHMQRCRGSALTKSELNARSLPCRLRDAAARLLMPYL
jgi:cardiolipin synthase